MVKGQARKSGSSIPDTLNLDFDRHVRRRFDAALEFVAVRGGYKASEQWMGLEGLRLELGVELAA